MQETLSNLEKLQDVGVSGMIAGVRRQTIWDRLHRFLRDTFLLGASPKMGKACARSNKPVKSHSAQNIGNEVCKIILVELK